MLFWCHIRHLNPLKIHPERTAISNKIMVNDLDYEGIKFPVSKKDYSKIEQKIIFPLMYFVMKIIYQMKNLKTVWTYC